LGCSRGADPMGDSITDFGQYASGLFTSKMPLARGRGLHFDGAVKPGRILLEAGARNCSDAQLLAILLGSGGKGYSALDSANALLDRYGTLAGMMNRPLDEVAQIRGIKVVRAVRLAAAYEICQRLLKEIDREA